MTERYKKMSTEKNCVRAESAGAWAIFLDIDGTLLSRGELPEKNVRMIREAQARGHKVLVNTGRSYAFIPWKKLESISFDGVCAGCGADIRIGESVLYSREVDRRFVKRTVDEYKKSGRPLFLEGEQACFWVNPSEKASASAMISASDFPCFELVCGAQFEEEFAEYKVSKYTFWEPGITQQEKALWAEELRVIEHPTYSESVIVGCDKALGMKIALDALGIPRERSIAMGDSANDIEMLEYAAIGVAMGGATEQVKSICQFISTDASDGGVGHAISELFLIK